MKTIAVIAGRKGSERVPRKIFQEIDGESLMMRKVHQLANLLGTYLQDVVVCSDAEEFQEDVESAGAIFYRQPDELCKGHPDKVNAFIKDALAQFTCDQVLWAHPTNPFIETLDYVDALQTLDAAREEGYNSLFSVNKLNGHFWTHLPSPINFAPLKPKHIIANELMPVYNQNGGIFIRPYDEMAEDGKLVGTRAFMYAQDQVTGWDIDYPWQMEFARVIGNNLELLKEF